MEICVSKVLLANRTPRSNSSGVVSARHRRNGNIHPAWEHDFKRLISKGPSENYGNEEHTTVAAFLPWRGS